ncbi:MAG: 50S ribosomal protein L6 [Bacilli bacterium]|jgi:large subunit ribosomal protein L6|nr:50S ribosomal protein L6 [Bacilli bacterium]
MSRIGFKPVSIPSGVSFEIKDGVATVKGAKGEVSVRIPSDVSVEAKDGVVHVAPIIKEDGGKQSFENHGTTTALLLNAVKGVAEGFKKELEVFGTGYRCQMKGQAVSMFLGYSHTIEVNPVGKYTKISCPDETHILVEGCDKQEVGQTAALIYDSHRPDVYGNKGVHFKGQHLIKKVGKRAATTATAGAKK